MLLLLDSALGDKIIHLRTNHFRFSKVANIENPSPLTLRYLCSGKREHLHNSRCNVWGIEPLRIWSEGRIKETWRSGFHQLWQVTPSLHMAEVMLLI